MLWFVERNDFAVAFAAAIDVDDVFEAGCNFVGDGLRRIGLEQKLEIAIVAPLVANELFNEIVNFAIVNHRHVKRSARIVGVFLERLLAVDNYPAKKIANYYGAKYIYEIHDLWPLSPMELGGYSPKHPFIRVMQSAEDFAYANVDAVVSMLPKAIDHAEERGLPREKFFYVPNGIVEEDWESPQDISVELRSEIEAIKAKSDYVIGYLGGHAVSNCLDTFIDAAKILSEKRIAFVLVGSGVEKERLVQRVAAEGIKNVFFFDPIPKTQVPSLLSLMDSLFIGWNKNPLYRFGISPNKIFDYMMSGKPIVHAVEAANDPVVEAGCGISVEPENPKAIADAVMKLASVSASEREEMGRNGHDYVLKYHTYSVLSQKFVDVMNKISK